MSSKSIKRFYKEVTVVPVNGGFAVELDGKPLITPGRTPLQLMSRPLIEALAEEWRSQGDELRPDAMPITRFLNTAIDRVATQRDAIIEQVLAFGRSDVLCYRAVSPPELAQRQAAAWDDLLLWMKTRFGAPLLVGNGLSHITQPEGTMVALKVAIETRGNIQLTGLHTAATITRSIVLALALAERRINAEKAFAFSRIDEDFQAEKWGRDFEAQQVEKSMAAEMAMAERILMLAGPSRPAPASALKA